MASNGRENTNQSGKAPVHQDLMQLVSFLVGGEEFGIDILRVREIIRAQEFTRVPNSPDFIAGVINLRGRVIPVLSLRKRFGLEEQPHDKQTRIVVVELTGNILGFIVDSVSEVLRIPVDTFQPPPRLGQVEREYVSGVVNVHERLLILLDVAQLMSHSGEAQLQAPVN